MSQAPCIHADAPWIEELRTEIRQRPFLRQFADLVILWEHSADQALALDRLEWAATCQERAANAAHRLALLEDGMLDIVLSRAPSLIPRR